MAIAIRIVHQLIFKASQDVTDNQKNVLAQRDADLAKVTIDTYAKLASHNFDIASAGVWSLDLGDITSPAKGLYLEVNNDCAVRLSGSADPINMKKPPNGALAKLFIEADISSVQITADQGQAVEGYYILWGEAAP